ncbi:hypothetical protein LINPERPRIM_LOCUS24483 [Linum perenne]
MNQETIIYNLDMEVISSYLVEQMIALPA